jgi:hypothetical protein
MKTFSLYFTNFELHIQHIKLIILVNYQQIRAINRLKQINISKFIFFSYYKYNIITIF